MLGTTISHYRVLRKLGGGGMGVVYEAEDLKLDRHVALKFLPGEMRDDVVALRRFQQEAQAASALDHPNICTIYEVGEHEGQPFLAMQLLEGETLAQRIQGKPLAIDFLLDLGLQIADALCATHAKAIIHRDIKPANIFVTVGAQVKVLDFGLAKKGTLAAAASAETALTDPRGIIGTLSYMSPEQVRGKELDARTDLFSFGAVLYEMATGVMPFRGESAGIVTDAILNREPVSPVRLNPDVPAELEKIIHKALEKDCDLRYQSATDLRSDLKRLKRDLEFASRPATAVPQPVVTIEASPSRWRWIVVPLLAIVAGAGFLFYGRRTAALTEQDTILIADFDNRTGDPVFDDALKQALATDLGQTPFLNILPDAQIRQTLNAMGLAKGARLTGDVARDVCARNKSKVAIGGTIAALGSQYVVGLNAMNCDSGAVILREEQTASRKEDVLKALGRGVPALRRKLGESLASIEKFDVPLEQITTPSLEAFQDFARGYRVWGQKGEIEALPLFRHAIQLDPSFAMALSSLSTIYANLGDTAKRREYATKAFELRDRASMRERFYIEANYHEGVTGDLPKAIETFKIWAQTYPQDFIAHNNLGGVYSTLGDFDDALAETRQALRIAPWVGIYYSNVSYNLISLNRKQEVQPLVDEALRLGNDSHYLHLVIYELAFLDGDAAGMQRQIDLAKGKPYGSNFLAVDADSKASVGRLREARELTSKSVALARAARDNDQVATSLLAAALREVLFGNSPAARQQADAAMRIATDNYKLANAAFVLAESGEITRAETLAARIAKESPSDTQVNSIFLPVIRASVHLQRGEAERALDTSELALPYDKSNVGMYSRLLRGRAYLELRKPAEAAAEFKAILDQRDNLLNYPIKPVALIGLARGYAASGKAADAKAAYETFFKLWREADAEVPLLQQAKSEYAKLE